MGGPPPGAEGGEGQASVGLLEVRRAQGVAQRLVQGDTGLGAEVGRVRELHGGAGDQGGHPRPPHRGGTVARGGERTQTGRCA